MKNAICLFAVAVIVLVIFVPSYKVLQDKKAKVREYEQEIRDLKAKQAKLIEEQDLLENDPAYLEKVAREKMGLIKEGEEVVEIMQKDRE